MMKSLISEHKPYDCKIELEPDTSLYKGTIYSTSPRVEKAFKRVYRWKSRQMVYSKIRISCRLPCIVPTQESREITTIHGIQEAESVDETERLSYHKN